MSAVRAVWLLGLAGLGASPGAGSAFPEALTRPLTAAVTRERSHPWTWPPRSAFEQRWSERARSGAAHQFLRVRVAAVEDARWSQDADGPVREQPTSLANLEALQAKGSLGCRTEGWYFERTGPSGQATLVPAVTTDDSWCGRHSWKVVEASGALRAGQSTYASARLEVVETLGGGPAPQAVLEEWTYVATLVHTDVPVDAPGAAPAAYRRKADVGPDVKALLARGKAGRAELLSGLDTIPSNDDARWQSIRAWATQRGDDALLREVFRHYRPVGRCSMDTAPAEQARQYADFCFDRGDLGCFLQLQVRIMGDQFDRVAWSSYGEAQARTQVDRLADTGADVRRFLRGLLFRLPGERAVEINAPRLARSMVESKTDAAFLKELPQLAADPALDPLNRLRATQTWVALLFRTGSRWPEVEATLAAAALHPVAKTWWEQTIREERPSPGQ